MNFQFQPKNESAAKRANEKVNASDAVKANEDNKENVNKQTEEFEAKIASFAQVNNSRPFPNGIKVTKIFVTKEYKAKEKHSSPFNAPMSNFFFANSRHLPVEYLQDIWTQLKSDSAGKDEACSYDLIIAQSDVNPAMRSILVDWLQNLHCHCKMKEETLFLSVSVLDRFLSKKQATREKLQLIGVASLYIASKYEEVFYPSAEFFSGATDYAFTAKEIVEYEYLILTTLNFSLTMPLPTDFYSLLCFNLYLTPKEYFFGLFLLEMFQLDIQYTSYSSLTLAQTAAYLTLKNSKRREMGDVQKEREPDVKECTRAMIAWAKAIGTQSYKAVLIKFLQERFMKISEVYLEQKKKE